MPNKKAAWTVMVYLAGDNNLTSECLFALTEMKKADPGDEINVIAQFDPRDEYLPTHRYEINRRGSDTSIFDDIIDRASFDQKNGEVRFAEESTFAESLAKSRARYRKDVKSVLGGANALASLPFEGEPVTDDTDTGSPITLYNFLSFCVQKYPAYHYMVVLSGHAGGTESDYLLKDESSKGSLTFHEMKQVFTQLQTDLKGQTIDILGMDNCLMSMGEICYEFRGLAQIVVGCESYSPASGWPYRQIIERLKKDFVSSNRSKRNSVQVEAAKALVEEYVNYYSPYWVSGLSVTQSALDVRQVEELRRQVDSLAAKMELELKKDQSPKTNEKAKGRNRLSFTDSLVLAHWDSQSYNGESFVDLFDFCDCLERRTSSDAITRQCRKMKRFIAEKFVLKSCYSGASYQYSYGVSVYFPWSQISSRYENLDFVKDSSTRGWLQFLKTYTELTRRRPRGFDGFLDADNPSAGEDAFAAGRMTDLRMTDLRMTDLRMTDLRMTDLRMTDLRMTDLRMTDLRMTDLRMLAGEGKNPVSSMRNPPVVFFPTDCLTEHKKMLDGLRLFFLPSKTRSRSRRK